MTRLDEIKARGYVDPDVLWLIAQVERLRGLLREWTDMDPLRYDSEFPCPWCAFDYSKMRHEPDCAFVLARAEAGMSALEEPTP